MTLSNSKTLIVTGFPPMRGIIKSNLANIGLSQSTLCANGKEAILHLSRDTFDLVISDLEMPIMDGLELITWIRNQELLKHLPFIMITSEGNKELVLTAISAGVTDFLIKPFTPNTLKNKVYKNLNSSHFNLTGVKPVDLNPEVSVLKSATNDKLISVEKSDNTILVVDDNTDNIDVISNLLKKTYKVKAAINGEKALSMVNSDTPPNLILLDIMMPEMDGYEVCQRIKNNPEKADIPIIFLSAKGEVADITKGFSLGAVDYVTKPIEPEILKARIKTHLSLRKAYSDLQSQVDTMMANACIRENVERMTQHDLKIPLGEVVNHMALMNENELIPDCIKQQVQSAHKSANNALDIVSNSIDLYKMETGNYEVNPAIVNISDTLEKVVKNLKFLAIENLNKIEVREFTKEHYVYAEEQVCKNILTNMLSTGINFSPERAKIKISVEDAIKEVAIRFYFEGVLPPIVRDIILQHNTALDVGDGENLGLYAAKVMVIVLGGTIHLETTNKNNTVFTIKLPKPP